MRRAVIAMMAVLQACSSAPSSAPPPSACRRTDRHGTYMLTWTQQAGGTCGPVAPGLVSLDAQTATDGGTSGCVVHSDVWLESDCKNERTITCVTRVTDRTQPGGVAVVTSDLVTVTRQETADGSTIDGTFTVQLDDPSGGCRSTYSVVYVRQ